MCVSIFLFVRLCIHLVTMICNPYTGYLIPRKSSIAITCRLLVTKSTCYNLDENTGLCDSGCLFLTSYLLISPSEYPFGNLNMICISDFWLWFMCYTFFLLASMPFSFRTEFHQVMQYGLPQCCTFVASCWKDFFSYIQIYNKGAVVTNKAIFDGLIGGQIAFSSIKSSGHLIQAC